MPSFLSIRLHKVSPSSHNGMADTRDWRTELEPKQRQEVLAKIFNKLRTCVPILNPGILPQLRSIAVKYEAKVYATAPSTEEYFIRICTKLESITTAPHQQSQQHVPHPQSQLPQNHPPSQPGNINSLQQVNQIRQFNQTSQVMAMRQGTSDASTDMSSATIDEDPGPVPGTREGAKKRQDITEVSSDTQLDSTETSRIKRRRVHANHYTLLEEIEQINERLVETKAEICEEDVSLPNMESTAECGEATIVKLSYSSKSKAHHALRQWLLIPETYPHCSPTLMEQLPIDESNKCADLSLRTRFRCNMCASFLSEPVSVKDMIKEWDGCARAVIFLHT